MTGLTGHHDLSEMINPDPAWLPTQNNAPPFGQYTKFSIHQVLHSDNHPTHTLHPTLGHASAFLPQEGQVPFFTLLIKETSNIPATAILFLPFSFLLLSHMLNKPTVTAEHQLAHHDYAQPLQQQYKLGNKTMYEMILHSVWMKL